MCSKSHFIAACVLLVLCLVIGIYRYVVSYVFDPTMYAVCIVIHLSCAVSSSMDQL